MKKFRTVVSVIIMLIAGIVDFSSEQALTMRWAVQFCFQ